MNNSGHWRDAIDFIFPGQRLLHRDEEAPDFLLKWEEIHFDAGIPKVN